MTVSVTTEQTLSSGHRADVALINSDGSVRAVFEILHTHEVDAEKANAMRDLPWVEVQADDVLKGNDWRPTKDHFKAVSCATCRQVRKFGKEYQIFQPARLEVDCPLPQLSHRASLMRHCARCEYFVSASPTSIFCTGSQALPHARVR